MSTTDNPPPTPNDLLHDPASPLSHTMHLAAWIAGARGSKACPQTAAAVLRMSRERSDVARASKGWDDRRAEAPDALVRRWGRGGVGGWLDGMSGEGPKPRGTELIRWWREEGGGGSSAAGAVSVAGTTTAAAAATVGGQRATAEPPTEEPAAQEADALEAAALEAATLEPCAQSPDVQECGGSSGESTAVTTAATVECQTAAALEPAAVEPAAVEPDVQDGGGSSGESTAATTAATTTTAGHETAAEESPATPASLPAATSGASV